MNIRSIAVGVCARGLIVVEDTAEAIKPVAEAAARFGAEVKATSIEVRRERAVAKLERLGERITRDVDQAAHDLELTDFAQQPA